MSSGSTQCVHDLEEGQIHNKEADPISSKQIRLIQLEHCATEIFPGETNTRKGADPKPSLRYILETVGLSAAKA